MDSDKRNRPPSPRLEFPLSALPAPFDDMPYGHTAAQGYHTYTTTTPLEDRTPPLGSSSSNAQAAPAVARASLPSATLIRADSGPSRKQNVACDACRTKKIRCKRQTIAENCEQCSARGATCTSNYVESLQAKAKKGRQGKDVAISAPPADASAGRRKRSRAEDEEDDRNGRQGSSSSQMTPSQQTPSLPRYHHNPARPPSDLRPSEKQANLVRYLLSSVAVTHHHLGYSDLSSMEGCEAGCTDLWEEQGGRVWSEDPTEAHAGLTDVGTRELADDLVDTFFSLVHPRFAMLDPVNIRARLSAPDTHPDGPVPHNLLAVAIAFGGRLSEHSIVNADREECMTRDEASYGGAGRMPPRSRLAQLLIIRAREVVEVQKTHRIGSLGNVQVLVMLESLLAQMPFMRARYTPYNIGAAIKHVCSLGYNNQRALNKIASEKERSSALLTWWSICIADGFRSVFHRLKPCLPDANYDLIPADAEQASHRIGISGPCSANGHSGEQAVVWFGAASAGSKMCRQLCEDLWDPHVHDYGIPLHALERFLSACSSWRDNYLARLGVPNKWPGGWGFDAAIAACSTDAYYHTLWLVVERAIKDFGVAELRQTTSDRPPGLLVVKQIEVVRKRIRDEAEHGAIRIASLTSTLALNHYLRLDPLILNQPIYEAGLFLAEHAREECMIPVAGLRQYCIPYPQFWSQAEEIERLYKHRQGATAMPAGPMASVAYSNGNGARGNGGARVEHGRGGMGGVNGTGSGGDIPLAHGQAGGPVGFQGAAGEGDISRALFDWLHAP